MRFERKQYMLRLVETVMGSLPGALNRYHFIVNIASFVPVYSQPTHFTRVSTAPWTCYDVPALRSSDFGFSGLLGALEGLAMLLVSTIN
jgi:hypothetical protein